MDLDSFSPPSLFLPEKTSSLFFLQQYTASKIPTQAATPTTAAIHS
jgi:hypothetical protein